MVLGSTEDLDHEEQELVPSRQLHRQFDDYLIKQGVICDDTDGSAVHDRMDKNALKLGPNHRQEDPYHSVEAIREWIYFLVEGLGTITKERRTDYVRVAWGHKVMDYMVSKLKRQYNCTQKELDTKLVIQRAWRYYRDRGYHRARYRGPNRSLLEKFFGTIGTSFK